MNKKATIPGWFTILAVLVTASVTAWAMLQRGGIPDSAYPVAQVPTTMIPAAAVFNHSGLQVAQVAATRGVPPVITAGTVPPHRDRGSCTTCHTVLDPRGTGIQMISALSIMPHQYRGVCTNCHRLTNQNGVMTTTIGQLTAGRATNTIGPAAAEGEWMGLEVAPITNITAVQYGIAQGTRGLVIVEADLQAGASGLRAGDVVLNVNGMPAQDLTAFFKATRAGALTRGAVEVSRKGRHLVANIDVNAISNMGVPAPVNNGIAQGMR